MRVVKDDEQHHNSQKQFMCFIIHANQYLLTPKLHV